MAADPLHEGSIIHNLSKTHIETFYGRLLLYSHFMEGYIYTFILWKITFIHSFYGSLNLHFYFMERLHLYIHFMERLHLYVHFMERLHLYNLGCPKKHVFWEHPNNWADSHPNG